MEKYYFVYSVDYFTISGCISSATMIMDRDELTDVLGTISDSGCKLSGVTCCMYDPCGMPVGDRDVTRLLGLKTA